MWNLVKSYLLYPLARFFFEFLGDHLWVAVILVLLVAILIWRFCMPVVVGFYKLFGWQGYALLAASIVTLGAFGAGWRAHRDASLDPDDPKYHDNEPGIQRAPTLFPDGDAGLKEIFNGAPKKRPAVKKTTTRKR